MYIILESSISYLLGNAWYLCTIQNMCVSQNIFCVSERATCFCLYVGRSQDDTISKAHVEKYNV